MNRISEPPIQAPDPAVAPPTLVDSAQRQRALQFDQSFAVSAPAGSGKTELLTQRTLTLLAHVEEPEEILAITFTRKAAAEMRARILKALQRAEDDTPPASSHETNTWRLARAVLERDHRKNWQLIATPSRLRIQTIDGFCMQLTRRMPLLSKVGAGARVSEDPGPLYQQATRRLLSRINEKDSAAAEDVKFLLSHLDNNAANAEVLLCSILAKREQWLRHLVSHRETLPDFKDYLEDCLHTLAEETLSSALDVLEPVNLAITQALDFAATNVILEKPDSPIALCEKLSSLPDTNREALPQWLGVVELLLTKSGRWRGRLTKNEGYPGHTALFDKAHCKQAKQDLLEIIDQLKTIPGALEQLAEIKSLPQPRYAENQWQLLAVLSRLLPVLAAELMLVFSEKGSVDYAHIGYSAFNALGEEEAPSDLALVLDHQLRHILIDEFQDTSSAQFALLERLTAGWEPGDGRTLFIVGDAMQSCYAFRDANVGLFMVARDYGVGQVMPEALNLKVNFRSEPGIVNWVNDAFSQAFPAQYNIARGAVSYSDSIAIQTGMSYRPAVQTFICKPDAEDERAARTVEAAKVMALVQESFAVCPDDSIAILVRNRSHLRAIIPALQSAGLVWDAVDIDPLQQRPVISDLFALTQALSNPLDKTAWLAILRAPWCGLSLKDLYLLVNPTNVASEDGANGNAATAFTSLLVWQRLQHPDVVRQLSAQGQTACSRLRDIIQAALDQRGRQPLRRWLEGVWIALGGPLTAVSADELALVPAYLELLEQHEAGGRIRDMIEFREALQRLYAKPAEQTDEQPGSNRQPQLKIMTIHKSKGLEFDHVIVPGLDRSSPSNQRELMLWQERLTRDGTPQLLISPVAASGSEPDPIYAYLQREKLIKERLESTRLLYVAATRAAKRLSLLACLDGDAENDLLPPRQGSLLHCLWPVVEKQREVITADSIAPAAPTEVPKPTGQLRRFRTAPSGFASQLLRLDAQKPEVSPEAGASLQKTQRLQFITDLQQASVNQCFAELFKAIAEAGGNSPNPEFVDQLPTIITTLVPPSELSSAGHEADRATISAAIRSTLTNPKGCWLMSQAPSDVRANQWLSRYHEERLSKLFVPLAFSVDSQRWVVALDLAATPENVGRGQQQLDRWRQMLEGFQQRLLTPDTDGLTAAVYYPQLDLLLAGKP